MILLRTMQCNAIVLQLAEKLQRESQDDVVFLVDERNGLIETGPYQKLSLTREACRELRIYAPRDFAWRCGDYGFYLARIKYPEVDIFWMIEFDVEIVGQASRFFEAAATRLDVDLLVAYLQPAKANWWWYPTAAAADVAAYRCFFPVTRLTKRGVDCLLHKRQAQSRQFGRRRLWPNDESFVATTIINAGLKALDINELGERFYDEEDFSFDLPAKSSGRPDRPPGTRLIHPFLTGEDLARKKRRLEVINTRPASVGQRVTRRLAWGFNSLTRW